MTFFELVIFLVVCLLILDNLRLRREFNKTIEASTFFNTAVSKNVFHYLAHVLFEAEVLNFSAMDASQYKDEEELIDAVFLAMLDRTEDE